MSRVFYRKKNLFTELINCLESKRLLQEEVNMNDFKDIAYLEIIEDIVPDEYVTPSVICTKDMPFANNIRLAAVSVNVVVFSET